MVQFYGRLWEGAKRPNSKPRSSFKVPEGTIAEGYLSEMNHVYMEIFPSYSQIVADYDKMQHRAQVYRKKASSPERAQWTLPGRELTRICC